MTAPDPSLVEAIANHHLGMFGLCVGEGCEWTPDRTSPVHWSVQHDRHVAAVIAPIIEARVEAERERIALAIEAHYLGADFGRRYDGTESPETALGHAHDEALEYAATIARTPPKEGE